VSFIDVLAELHKRLEKYKDLVDIEKYESDYLVKPKRYLGDTWKEIHELLKPLGGVWSSTLRAWMVPIIQTPDVLWHGYKRFEVKKKLPSEFWKERDVCLMYVGRGFYGPIFEISYVNIRLNTLSAEHYIKLLEKYIGPLPEGAKERIRETVEFRDKIVLWRMRDRPELLFECHRFDENEVVREMEARGWAKREEDRTFVDPKHLSEVKEFLQRRGFTVEVHG